MEFDAAVQLPSPAYDAVTGQTTSTLVLDDAPVRYAVEAGYDAAGAFVFNQYALDPPGDPLRQSVDPVRTLSVHNGRIEMLDAAGQPLPGTGGGNGPSLQAAMDAPSSESLQILDQMVLSKAPLTGTTSDFSGSSVAVTSVTETGDLVTVQAQVSSTEPGMPTLPQRRTYRKTTVSGAERLTLLEVRTDIATSSGGAQMTGQAVIRIDGLLYARNATRDQMRLNGTAGNAFGSTPTNLLPYIPPPCSPGDEFCNPTVPVDPTGGAGNPNGGSQAGCGLVAGGANLVYVHGIFSGGDAWGDPAFDNRIRGRARCDFQIGSDSAPNLSSGAHHAVQTAELRSSISGVGRPQNILIGHSQGGLVSRRAAQYYATHGEGNRIKAVITIGTPHLGANIARNLPTTALEGLSTVFAQPIACRLTGACNAVTAGLLALRQGLLVGVGALGADALTDLRPGSPALAEVNGVPEGNLFPRYGIHHYTNKRWMPMRLAGDATLNPNGIGPAFVTISDVVFGGATILAVSGIFSGHWALTVWCVRIMYHMTATENWWLRITSGGETTDGVVEGPSQNYPGAILEVNARLPTSHLGENDTERSYVEIEEVLRVQQLATPRQ